jgi:hypothetical protein
MAGVVSRWKTCVNYSPPEVQLVWPLIYRLKILDDLLGHGREMFEELTHSTDDDGVYRGC